jgi:hypothetical protein
MKRAFPTIALVLVAGAAACEPAPAPPVVPPPPLETVAATASTPPPPPAAPPPKLDAIPRLEFNRLAAELDLPLFWMADTNGSGSLDVDELATLWGVGAKDTVWIKDGAFAPALYAAYAQMIVARAKGASAEGLDEPERRRRAAVRAELAQGMPSLVRSDFRHASAEDRGLVEHVLAAAEIIERIYGKQRGTAGMLAEIPPGDAASRMVFYRNQGPWCDAPKTEKDPDCNALARRPARVSGYYPAAIQKDPKFCATLDARPDQKALLTPFNVVVERNGDLAAVPYQVAYKDEMEAVSRELTAAAEAVQSPGEAALKAYLTADAKAFLDGDWFAADEVWAKMGTQSSKWYLRVAPDETYADPCSRKAGFQVSFALINQDSIAWRQKLDPRKKEMEGVLAKLAGAPYKAHEVTFHLPDFIDVVLNAGDARAPLGATVGESLPNFGPVADQNRGRTMAMTNFYLDADNRAAFREKAASMLCKGSYDPAASEPALQVMSTVLHEAAHNLGPANDYKVKGKTGSEIFGGPLAATLEELKAQTSALFLADWLAQKGVIDKKTAGLAHVGDILWCMGHISEGMYGADGAPKHYSHLAAIQVGAFVDAGALVFHPHDKATNDKDEGCLEIKTDKLPAAIAALEKRVLGMMARGDKADAVKLRAKHVDSAGPSKQLRDLITERWLRHPRATFVYSIER